MRTSAPMSGYGAREVARMLGLSVGQVRSYVRAGFLDPARGMRGALRFSFSDLVLLRAAKGLVAARIPSRRVKRALALLRAQLPEGRSLRDVHIRAEGDRIVVGDGARRWSPEDGQVLFDFGTAELARRIAPLARKASDATADDLFERGCDLEEADREAAAEAYAKALELDPGHADSHVNLGRLMHEAGDAESAAQHYRCALTSRPDDSTAAFNLGVALEDLGRRAEAISAYQLAVACDPPCPDAHYNLSRIYEHLGQGAPALRHLRTYRALTGKN
ncbi:MAG: tetratricopeptide repeat protein [Myxococcales bacterium]